jgi:hypothetical protein
MFFKYSNEFVFIVKKISIHEKIIMILFWYWKSPSEGLGF